MQIDLNALANFVEETLDCSADYEEDCFCFDFQGQRIYCERHRNCFKMEVGSNIFEMPR